MSRYSLSAGIALLIVVAGCGAEEGIGEGAFVDVYATAPLCGEAQGALSRAGKRVGGVDVRLVCQRSVEVGGRLDLAQLGRNARAATEDSAAVAYLAESEPAQSRFLRPILESAEIPIVANSSGAVAMSRLLRAIEEAGDTGSLREAVSDELVRSGP